MCPFHFITLFSVHQIWEGGRAFERVDHNHYRVIDMMYWRRTHTAIGVGMVLKASKSTVYNWIDDVVMLVAKELGYI